MSASTSSSAYLVLTGADEKQRFCHVTVRGKVVIVRFGPVGRSGTAQRHAFDTPEEAAAFGLAKIAAKEREGYLKLARAIPTATRRKAKKPVR